jgi:hypothetical protein
VSVTILQAIIATVTILSFTGGACAFLFVIWPSIRSAERRGARLEAWCESDEAKRFVSAVKSKIGLEEGGTPSSREDFLGSRKSTEERNIL